MRVSPNQNNFTSGEVTPLAHARVDIDRYRAGLDVCEGFVPMIQGGLTRFPGTRYVGPIKNQSNKSRLVKFVFSAKDAMVLEFGHEYVRFYRNHALVYSGPSIYEVATPYAQADLAGLRFRQSNDVVYITHPKYPPARLNRYAVNEWNYHPIRFTEAPWGNPRHRVLPAGVLLVGAHIDDMEGKQTGSLFRSVEVTKFPASHTTGEAYITGTNISSLKTGDKIRIQNVNNAAALVGSWRVRIEGDPTTASFRCVIVGSVFASLGGSPEIKIQKEHFAATDVGRKIKVYDNSNFRTLIVTAFTNTAQVTVADIFGGALGSDFSLDSASEYWQFDIWSATTGYPAVSCFYQQRLTFAGTPSFPQRIDFSKSGDFENFAVTTVSNVVTPDSAIAITLDSDDTNLISWISPAEKGLLAGTANSEWVVRPASADSSLSPTNVRADEVSKNGSAEVDPLKAGDATLFAQGSKRKIREFSYNYERDGFRYPDLTALSEHITLGGIEEFAHAKDPYSVIWVRLGNGSLVGLTYERDIDSIVAGWHRQPIGGVRNAEGAPAAVESIAVIPSPDGTRSELWMIVQRYVNGSVARYVEYCEKFFSDEVELDDAFFVHSGLTYDNPKNITGATQANPVVITSTAHGFSDGDKVKIVDVEGMEELNGRTFEVDNSTTDTFELKDEDGTTFDAYLSGGKVRKKITTLSGLSHLEGESVDVLGDGGDMGSYVVTGGSITLPSDYPVAIAHVGLGYKSRWRTLRIEAGAADGTSQGKQRRVNQVTLDLYRSVHLKLGMSFDALFEHVLTRPTDPESEVPALYTGFFEASVEGDYDTENKICGMQDRPLPMTLLAILPQMTTYDKG